MKVVMPTTHCRSFLQRAAVGASEHGRGMEALRNEADALATAIEADLRGFVNTTMAKLPAGRDGLSTLSALGEHRPIQTYDALMRVKTDDRSNQMFMLTRALENTQERIRTIGEVTSRIECTMREVARDASVEGLKARVENLGTIAFKGTGPIVALWNKDVASIRAEASDYKQRMGTLLTSDIERLNDLQRDFPLACSEMASLEVRLARARLAEGPSNDKTSEAEALTEAYALVADSALQGKGMRSFMIAAGCWPNLDVSNAVLRLDYVRAIADDAHLRMEEAGKMVSTMNRGATAIVEGSPDRGVLIDFQAIEGAVREMRAVDRAQEARSRTALSMLCKARSEVLEPVISTPLSISPADFMPAVGNAIPREEVLQDKKVESAPAGP